MRALVRLMTVPEEKRDGRWLEEGLQAAVELEMSTIPPYLYAAWSIDQNADPAGARDVIVQIAREEMLHMGIACNLLAAIGGRPRIVQVAPAYPTRLPKDIHEGLAVALEPLSRQLLLTTFMAIEEPVANLVDDSEFVPSGSTLIGEFYDKLQRAFDDQTLDLDTARQVELPAFLSSSGAPFVMASLDDVRKGIDLIKRQGEGTGAAPFEKSDPDELAHFYQFGELAHGRRLTRTAPFTYTGEPVPLPGVRAFAPADATQPQAREFNRLYSAMLGDLEQAWDGGGTGKLDAAVGTMFALSAVAMQLFQAGAGPGFVVVDDSGEPLIPPAVGNRFARVKEILDAAVGPVPFGAHGPFWRGLSRDQFVQHAVFGFPLLVIGNGQDSNLVKALRGQNPFGKNIGTPGAIFNRMPSRNLDPVAPADIDLIEQWIDDGCPDAAPAVAGSRVSLTTGAFRPDPSVHVAYFRELDDWSALHATPEVRQAIDRVFASFGPWMAFAHGPAREAAWVESLSGDATAQAIAMLSARQQQTVEAHYGVPAPLLALLDGFERFGNDGLPDDPRRPERHNMSGAIMWFVWGSFADACLQLEISAEFWRFYLRAILCGLLNDGLFRERFEVKGFEATPQGRLAAFQHAQDVADADLRGELRKRFVESGI